MIHKAIQEYEGSKEPELDAHPLEFDQDDLDADATHHDCESGVQVIYLYRITKTFPHRNSTQTRCQRAVCPCMNLSIQEKHQKVTQS